MIPSASLLGLAWTEFLTHVWQSTLVIVPVLLLARGLRRAPAGVIAALWSIAFLKLLLPLDALGEISRAILARTGFLPEAAPPLGRFGALLAGVVDPLTSLGTRASSNQAGETWALVATVLWITGVAWSLRRIAGALRDSRSSPGLPLGSLEPRRRSRLEEAARRSGVPLDALRWESRRDLPCVRGLLRPRIVMPEHLLTRLEGQELEAILLHEDAHRRRRDPLRETLASAVSSLYFFHPLVAHVRGRMLDAIELCCDARALDAGTDPQVYARALATAIQSAVDPRPAAAASRIHRGGLLRERLDRVRAPGRFTMNRRHTVLFALFAVIIVTGTLAPLPWLAGCSREDTPAPVAHESAAVAPSSQPAPEDGGAGQAERMPVVLKLDPPAYPEEARAKQIEGTVMVRVTVGIDGAVREAFVVEGPEVFVASALKAVNAATFRPALKNGQPVETIVQIPIRFALD